MLHKTSILKMCKWKKYFAMVIILILSITTKIFILTFQLMILLSTDLLSNEDTATFATEIEPCGEIDYETPTNVEPSPGTSLGSAQLPTESSFRFQVSGNKPHPTVKSSSKCTQDDVYLMQYKVLAGQLEQQDLEKKKISLQIELLQRLLTQNELDIDLNPTQLLMSILN